MARYSYYARGTAYGPLSRTGIKPGWQVHGEVIEDGPLEAIHRAMPEIFQKLTKGEAVFGSPGVGCDGPYTITMFLITREHD